MSSTPSGQAFSYDSRTIALHWITAAFIVGLWTIGQLIDAFPKGAPRISVRSCHILAGAILLPIVLYRIRWRFTQGVRLPESENGRGQKVASMLHGVIYLLVLCTIALGISNAWVRGDSLFQLVTIPEFSPGNKELAEQVADLHELAANTVAVVAVLHAAMGLVHHFALRDNVLRRMMPRR